MIEPIPTIQVQVLDLAHLFTYFGFNDVMLVVVGDIPNDSEALVAALGVFGTARGWSCQVARPKPGRGRPKGCETTCLVHNTKFRVAQLRFCLFHNMQLGPRPTAISCHKRCAPKSLWRSASEPSSTKRVGGGRFVPGDRPKGAFEHRAA
jgi:hypothetical protein